MLVVFRVCYKCFNKTFFFNIFAFGWCLWQERKKLRRLKRWTLSSDCAVLGVFFVNPCGRGSWRTAKIMWQTWRDLGYRLSICLQFESRLQFRMFQKRSLHRLLEWGQERTQEIRDKIKMGILQPPPPKAQTRSLILSVGMACTFGCQVFIRREFDALDRFYSVVCNIQDPPLSCAGEDGQLDEGPWRWGQNYEGQTVSAVFSMNRIPHHTPRGTPPFSPLKLWFPVRGRLIWVEAVWQFPS